jgi:hypothetical protein
MPNSSGRKPPEAIKAWRWLALVLAFHLFLALGLNHLTGRKAVEQGQSAPILVTLIERLEPPRPAPKPPPQAPVPAPPPQASEAGVPELPMAAQTQGIQVSPEGGEGLGRLPAPSPDLPGRLPTPQRPAQESLPAPGGLAIQAFFGEYTLGEKPLGIGEIRLSFPGQDRYEIELTARATGWVSALVSGDVRFKSEGTLSPYGLKPSRYSQFTPFRGASESRFDPERGAQLTPDAPWIYLPAGLQDRLSVVFQLAFIAQTRPEQFVSGQRHVLQMATNKEIKPLAFTVGETEELVLPGGILVSAVRVGSDPLEFRRQGRIELWLDPADRFYPVRIQYREPGGRVLDFLAIRDPYAPTPSGLGPS